MTRILTPIAEYDVAAREGLWLDAADAKKVTGWNQVKNARLKGPPSTLGRFSQPTVTGASAPMIRLPT